MDTYEQEQADREQYWAEMQRLRALDKSLRETQGAGQPEQQKEDQE